MKSSCEFESERRRKRRVLNIVELGDGDLVYIRLDDGKKYLLNGDGCWRCGSTADCFGNMDDSELEVVCEFDFFDEVRNLFLLLVKEQVMKIAGWLSDRIHGKLWILVERLVESFTRAVECVNLKSCAGNFF